jgi:hypothetical protein
MDYSVKEDIIEDVFESVKRLIIPSENNNYRSSFLQSNILLYCVVLLLILKIFVVLISINIPQNIFFADITRSALESFANQTRQSMGLPKLVENQKLNQAAQSKAQNMVQNNYFAHTSPSGVSPWFWFTKAGYNYKYAGENLAIGFFDSKEVYEAWLNSPSHKANIVNPNYTEVGTAVLSGFGPNNSIVVVQEFASPVVLPVKQTALKTNNTKPITVQVQQKPTPAPIVEKTEPSTTTAEKVLSQTTESQSAIEPLNKNSVNNLSSKIMNAVLYNTDDLLQNIVYGVSLIIIGILLMLIFLNFDIKLKRQLVFRSMIIIVLLFTATLIDRNIIILLVPHQMLI